MNNIPLPIALYWPFCSAYSCLAIMQIHDIQARLMSILAWKLYCSWLFVIPYLSIAAARNGLVMARAILSDRIKWRLA